MSLFNRTIILSSALFLIFSTGVIHAENQYTIQQIKEMESDQRSAILIQYYDLGRAVVEGLEQYDQCQDSAPNITNKNCRNAIVTIDGALLSIQSQIDLDENATAQLESVLYRDNLGSLTQEQLNTAFNVTLAIEDYAWVMGRPNQ